MRHEKDRNHDVESAELSLIESVGEPAAGIAFDISELALDAVFDVADDVPVVGTLRKLVKGAIGVRDYIFAKKVLAFLKGTATVTEEQRNNFEGDRRKTGEAMLMLIDRAASMKKAELLGVVFAAFLRSRMTREGMLEMTSIVDGAQMKDLLGLAAGESLDTARRWRLVNLGLIQPPQVRARQADPSPSVDDGRSPKITIGETWSDGGLGVTLTNMGRGLSLLISEPESALHLAL